MLEKKSLLAIFLVVIAGGLQAGDSASFVDLGFSPDGTTYMFGQYGVQSSTLKPWADLFLVDVPRNDFVAGGRVSYTHHSPVNAGQDGSGALYRLISRNTAMAERYGVDFLTQGQPLFIALDNGGGETIEFRDFETGSSYRASLVSQTEGSGRTLKSSFRITLECIVKDGPKKTYTAGNPQIKRPLISSYRIKKVMKTPRDGSLIFVVETQKQEDGGYAIRYMVEALRL